MISPDDFWDWFKKNNSKYFFLNQIDDEEEKEKLLNEFLEKLHEYCNKLFFEIGGFPDEPQDLIITAEGNIDYFNKVQKLVDAAPDLKDWNIIAFKPPKEFGYITDYEDVSLNPEEIWFSPIQNKSAFGLKIFINEFSPEKEEDYRFATAIALDNLLGEKLNAEYIKYLELEKMPSNPKKLGLMELRALPEYINRQKKIS